MRLFISVVIMAFVGLVNISAAETPVFSLAWSEYPSWSVFGVADSYKIIDGARGRMGEVEKKWGVDIELKEADYDTCLVMYGSGKCDAVCITNMDVLNPSLTVKSRAVLPTSTSMGADACIVDNSIKTVSDLKGKAVFGLAKTVSEYCFVRNLEILGKKEADYKFTNMDPAAAAAAMQQKKEGYEAIVVWNPFVLETLDKRKDCRVIFDSTSIPGEIIDMVVVSEAALKKDKGDKFACAVIEAFYRVNGLLADPATADEALLAIGEKFSNLKLPQMKKVVQQTLFYNTPEKGCDVLAEKNTAGIMNKVVRFCVTHDIVSKQPVVKYAKAGNIKGGADLVFDDSYIKNYMNTK